MKVCRMCGSTYGDRVDFCFQDGTPLVVAEVSPEPAFDPTDLPPEPLSGPLSAWDLDAPEPAALRRGLRAGGGVSEGPDLADASDVPLPRFGAPTFDEDSSDLPEPAALAAEPLPIPAPDLDAVPALEPTGPEFDLAEPGLDAADLPEPPTAPLVPDDALEPPAVIGPPEADVDALPPPPAEVDEFAGGEETLLEEPAEPDIIRGDLEAEAPEITLEEPLPEGAEPTSEEPAAVVSPTPEPEPDEESAEDEPDEDEGEPAPAVRLGSDAFDDEDDDLGAPPPRSRARLGLWLILPVLVGFIAVVALAGVIIIERTISQDDDVVATPTPPPARAQNPTAPPPTPPPVATEPEGEDAEDLSVEVADADPGAVEDELAATDEAPVADEPATAEPATAEVEPATAAAARPAAPTPARTDAAKAPAPRTAPEPVRAKAGKVTTPTVPATTVAATNPGDPWGAGAPAAQTGKMNVRTVPEGAMVQINGASMGRAPVMAELAYGIHTVKVTLDGYKDDQRRVDLASPQLDIPIELRPLVVMGNVNLFANGYENATVYIDGSLFGNLPTSVSLSEGTHRFRVVGQDGSTFEESRDVRFEEPGRAVTIVLGQ